MITKETRSVDTKLTYPNPTLYGEFLVGVFFLVGGGGVQFLEMCEIPPFYAYTCINNRFYSGLFHIKRLMTLLMKYLNDILTPRVICNTYVT